MKIQQGPEKSLPCSTGSRKQKLPPVPRISGTSVLDAGDRVPQRGWGAETVPSLYRKQNPVD
jgi:hypothetical protein